MPPVKLVVTDLDGTFFGEGYYVPEVNLKAVRDARDAGIVVCACSARLWGMGGEMAKMGGFDRMAVFNNGAAVADALTGEIAYKIGISPVHFKGIIEAASMFGAVVQSWNHDFLGIYDPTNNGKAQPIFDRYTDANAPVRCKAVIYDGIEAMDEACRDVAQKIMISIDNSYLPEVRKKVLEVCDVEVTSSNPRVIEITAPGATKGTGLARLAEYYGVDRESVLAIGDSHNDVCMLENAGIKVAVGNAEESMKRTAQHIVATNLEGGFAQAVYELALKR